MPASVTENQAELDDVDVDLTLDVSLAEARSETPKGGDPATGSPTATLLRLHPSRRPRRKRSLSGHGFGRGQLPWCDGRCVQGPGTYSPQRADLRLLAIPDRKSVV